MGQPGKEHWQAVKRTFRYLIEVRLILVSRQRESLCTFGNFYVASSTYVICERI